MSAGSMEHTVERKDGNDGWMERKQLMVVVVVVVSGAAAVPTWP